MSTTAIATTAIATTAPDTAQRRRLLRAWLYQVQWRLYFRGGRDLEPAEADRLRRREDEIAGELAAMNLERAGIAKGGA